MVVTIVTIVNGDSGPFALSVRCLAVDLGKPLLVPQAQTPDSLLNTTYGHSQAGDLLP